MPNVPNDPQAERAVLGACLLSSDALGEVSEILKPEDFYDANHKIVYEICLSMYLEGRPVDLVTFQSEAATRGVLERIGGPSFLDDLVSDTTTTANAGYYAETVQKAALRRRLIGAGQKISALGAKTDIKAEELVSEAEKIILDASTEKDTSGPVTLQAAAQSAIARINELKAGVRKNAGYMTHFTDLDRIIAGFQPGSLNVIAARPSMGKTALALNIAQFGGSEGGNHVLFFSLEMSAEQLTHRMFSAQTLEFGSGVGVSSIASGVLTEHEEYSLKRAVDDLQSRDISIYDSSELTAMDFRAKCRRFKTRHPELSLIVVDYLQLMSSGKRGSETRQYEVAEISRVMKSVAVELNCPVIALSQLSRNTENRIDKKPQLSDLRDSGAIEQDADVVMMLYRESYYAESEGSALVDDVADVRVAKNRNGATGACRLVFQQKYTRFMNYGG